MDNWERVTACPECGGKLVFSEYFTYSLDFHITKKGLLSKRFRKGEAGAIDCMTACCEECSSFWDAGHVFVENDGTVYFR